MNPIKEVNEGNFSQEVLQSEVPVLVDFWAPWCGPCRMVSPLLEEVAQEMGGKIKFVKLNTDQNQQIAAQYRIMAIPSLLLFKAGEEADRVIGFKPKDQLVEQLNGHIQP